MDRKSDGPLAQPPKERVARTAARAAKDLGDVEKRMKPRYSRYNMDHTLAPKSLRFPFHRAAKGDRCVKIHVTNQTARFWRIDADHLDGIGKALHASRPQKLRISP
jgi:hypothetical protein